MLVLRAKEKPVISENRAMTELDAVELVALSHLIFEEYSHALKLIDEIIGAGARILFFTDQPLDSEGKMQWLKTKKLGRHLEQKIEIIPISHDTIWLRDFSPIPTQLYSQAFDRLFLSTFRFRSDLQINDVVSYQIALYLNLNLLYAPVVMDGGNFLSDGTNCVMTDYVALEGENRINEKKLSEIYRNYFACEKLYIVSNPPHDHIDMFAKFVAPKTILVNDIWLNKEVFSGKDHALSIKYKKQLDSIAAQLSQYFTVIRLPMPPIRDGIFLTYANSLILNKTVLIPEFRENKVSEALFEDVNDLQANEEKIAKIYQSFDYKPIFINSDELIVHGGALHCVTAQLPQLVFKN